MTIKGEIPDKGGYYNEPEIALAVEPEPQMVFGMGSPDDPPMVTATALPADDSATRMSSAPPAYNPSATTQSLPPPPAYTSSAPTAPSRPPPPAYSASAPPKRVVVASSSTQPQPPPTYTSTTTHTAVVTNPASASTTVPPAANLAHQQAQAYVTNLGRNPKTMQCPYCSERMQTRTHDEVDCFTIAMVVLLVLTVWILFWIPLVSPCCKRTEHRCSKCQRKLGDTGPCE